MLYTPLVLIPLNSRKSSSKDSIGIYYDENGVPLCPNNSNLRFKSNSSCGGKNRSLRFKFICPKAKQNGKSFITTCENPCSQKDKVRTHYIYSHKGYRLYLGILWDSNQWIKTYKKRTVIEQFFASLKFNLRISNSRTLNILSKSLI